MEKLKLPLTFSIPFCIHILCTDSPQEVDSIFSSLEQAGLASYVGH